MAFEPIHRTGDEDFDLIMKLYGPGASRARERLGEDLLGEIDGAVITFLSQRLGLVGLTLQQFIAVVMEQDPLTAEETGRQLAATIRGVIEREKKILENKLRGASGLT